MAANDEASTTTGQASRVAADALVAATEGHRFERVSTVTESQLISAARVVQIRVGAFRHDRWRSVIDVERLTSAVFVSVIL